MAFYDLPRDEQIDRLRDVAIVALRSYPVSNVQLHAIGYSNNLFFRAETGEGRYALRVCREHFSGEDLRRETQWLAALGRDTDLHVATPLPADDGSLYVEASTPLVRDGRRCVLFRWLDGGHLSDELTPQHLRSLGKYVGTLHRHAETFRLPDGLRMEAWSGDTLSDDFPLGPFEAVYSADDLAVIAEAVDLAGQTMQEVGVGAMDCGIIHGDLHQMNYMFDGFDARAIDFEAPSCVCYLYDIAITLAYLRDMPMPMTYEVPPHLHDALEDAYYDGYSAARELPVGYAGRVEILKALKLLGVAQWIASSPNIRRMAWTQRYVSEMPGVVRKLLHR